MENAERIPIHRSFPKRAQTIETKGIAREFAGLVCAKCAHQFQNKEISENDEMKE
jgi:hypothetical protein